MTVKHAQCLKPPFVIALSHVFRDQGRAPIEILGLAERQATLQQVALAFQRVKGQAHLFIVPTIIKKTVPVDSDSQWQTAASITANRSQ